MSKGFNEIFSEKSREIIKNVDADINDPHVIEAFRDGNVFIFTHPTLSINNGKTISTGAYHLTGNYYFEISIFDENGDLVQLVYSDNITDEKFTSYEAAENAAVVCLLKH